MFTTAYQTSPLSLFSSTSSHPLSLFSVHVDRTLPADSFVEFLNDSTSEPRPAHPKLLLRLPDLSSSQAYPSHHTRPDDRDNHDDNNGEPYNSEFLGRQLAQTVLHIQSPTLRTTFIRCPPLPSPCNPNSTQVGGDLGLRLPHLHLQLRSLGRAFSFEVGVVDHAGRHGTIRCSTFQTRPKLYTTRHSPSSRGPLLHLPLAFPSASSRPLTSWTTVSLDLPSLLPAFSSLTPSTPGDDASAGPAQVPAGQFSHISYIKIYANCRLKRIWVSDTKTTPSTTLPWEFELYGS